MVTIIKKMTDVSNSDTYELMIDNASDLQDLEFYCAPGSIAYTTGFGTIYHLDANHVWKTV